MNKALSFDFHHIGVSVPNLEEAIAWYKHVLGFEVEKEFYVEAAKSKTAMMRCGGLRFELFEVEGAKPPSADRSHPPADLKTFGTKHGAFQVHNLDEFLDEVESRGADVAFVVRESFGKGCFLRDCAGNLIEFVEQGSG